GLRTAPASPLFPYTTLFRSCCRRGARSSSVRGRRIAAHAQERNAVAQFTFGPVEFYLVGLDGDRPSPAVISALTELIDAGLVRLDRKSTRLNSSHVKISYAV